MGDLQEERRLALLFELQIRIAVSEGFQRGAWSEEAFNLNGFGSLFIQRLIGLRSGSC